MTFDGVSIDTGDYKRQSIAIALVGPIKCSIHWAAGALSVHLPVNSRRGLYAYPHPSVDVSRNLAIDAWLGEKDKWKTEFLFLWATDSFVKWNTITAGMEICKTALKIGQSWMIHRSAVDSDAKPWFKDGDYRGTYDDGSQFMASKGGDEQLRKGLPRPAEDAGYNADQIFVCALPSLGFTSIPWIGHALQLAAPVASIKLLALMINYEVAVARERLVEAALAIRPRPRRIFFYGDDMLPQPESLQMISETQDANDWPCCAGLYHMKYRPPVQPLLWRSEQAGWLIPGKDFEVGDTIQVDGTGLDFCLINTDVFEKIPRPWFRTGHEFIEGKGLVTYTEDAYFWNNFQAKLGKKILVDTRARIGHYNDFDGSIY